MLGLISKLRGIEYMARCLVTGHKGYIGSILYKRLQEQGHEVMGIDIKSGNDILDTLKPHQNGNFHRHWVNFRPEYIFHLAAIPRVVYSIENPVQCLFPMSESRWSIRDRRDQFHGINQARQKPLYYRKWRAEKGHGPRRRRCRRQYSSHATTN